MIYIWLGVICISAIFEFITVEMAGIWFVAGGFLALLLALVGVDIVWQIVAFFALSLVLLLALRKICLRILLKRDEKTNIDALSGTTAKLLTAISPDNPGSLRINDVVWTAIANKNNIKIESDTEVKIIRVEGNKLVVEPAE